MPIINKYKRIHEAPEDEVDELIANNDIEETQPTAGGEQEENNQPPQGDEVEVDDDYLQQDPEEDPNAGEEQGMEMVEEEPPSEMQMIDNNIFGDLSAAEIAARDMKLKEDLALLYDLCNAVMNRIVSINKSTIAIKITEYISNKMEDLKDNIVDYLMYIYDSKSYIENLVYYKQCFSVIEGIALILKEIEPKEENK